MEVGLSPGDFVLDGDPAPYPQKQSSPLRKRDSDSLMKKELAEQAADWAYRPKYQRQDALHVITVQRAAAGTRQQHYTKFGEV